MAKYNFEAGNKRLSGNLKGYTDAKSKALEEAKKYLHGVSTESKKGAKKARNRMGRVIAKAHDYSDFGAKF